MSVEFYKVEAVGLEATCIRGTLDDLAKYVGEDAAVEWDRFCSDNGIEAEDQIRFVCVGGTWRAFTGDWGMRLELIDILFETKAKQLRGAVIIHQLSKPWALSYVDDDSLQALENAAIKIMEFIDTRRKKFEV